MKETYGSKENEEVSVTPSESLGIIDNKRQNNFDWQIVAFIKDLRSFIKAIRNKIDYLRLTSKNSLVQKV